jgi:hypothetical protein
MSAQTVNSTITIPGLQPPQPLSGVWLAYYTDWSGLAVFATEIEALRYAVDHTMSVAFREWGEIR